MPPVTVAGVPSSFEPNVPMQQFLKDSVDSQDNRATILERKVVRMEETVYGPPPPDI